MDDVLRIEDLAVDFSTRRESVRAVEGVSIRVAPADALAVVGASGSGKTALFMGALGLLPPNGRVVRGSAWVDGVDLVSCRPRELRRIHGRSVGVIFQDPQSSLHPSFSIGAQLIEALRTQPSTLSRPQARARAIELLDRVQVASATRRFDEFPHQWSGGMLQRAMIAMAIAHDPPVLVADEPTTALDVTVQAQILDLLRDLRREAQVAVVLVTHDLGIVAEFADRVAVMDAGKLVEQGAVVDIFARPEHPATASLLGVGS